MTVIELYGITQLKIITYDKSSSFPFKLSIKRDDYKEWSHFHMTECEIVQSCLDLQLPKQLETALNYLNIPKDLTVKEKLCYYQLLIKE